LTDMGKRLPEERHGRLESSFHLCKPILYTEIRTIGILVDTPGLAADSIVFLTSEKRDWLAGRYVSACWDMPEFMARESEISTTDLLRVRMNFEKQSTIKSNYTALG
jgi:hypothetical protein